MVNGLNRNDEWQSTRFLYPFVASLSYENRTGGLDELKSRSKRRADWAEPWSSMTSHGDSCFPLSRLSRPREG